MRRSLAIAGCFLLSRDENYTRAHCLPPRGPLRKRWLAISLILAAALSGCSALTSTSEFANHPPPKGLLVVPPVIPEAEPSVAVVVYRDGTFAGSANNRWLSLDKRLIASLMPLERVEFSVTPGSHELGVHCFAWGQWKEQIVAFDARVGVPIRYLMSKCAEMSQVPESAAGLWAANRLVKVGP